MLVNNILGGEDNYSIIVEGDTDIYIRNTDSKLNTKRQILGFNGEAFDSYEMSKDEEIISRLKETKPDKILVVYSTLAGLSLLYRYIDISLGLENTDIYLSNLEAFNIDIDINNVDFGDYVKVDGLYKRVDSYRGRRTVYSKLAEQMEISFDYRYTTDRNIKAVSHFMGSLMKMVFKEIEDTRASLTHLDICTYGGREEYQGRLKLFNTAAVIIYNNYDALFSKSIIEDRDTLLLKLDRPHWLNILHKINLKAEELVDEQYPTTESRFEALSNITDIIHPDDIPKHLKVTIVYEILQELIEKLFKEHLSFGISRLACNDMKDKNENRTNMLLFEYLEADKNYYKSEAEIYQALEKIMNSV